MATAPRGHQSFQFRTTSERCDAHHAVAGAGDAIKQVRRLPCHVDDSGQARSCSHQRWLSPQGRTRWREAAVDMVAEGMVAEGMVAEGMVGMVAEGMVGGISAGAVLAATTMAIGASDTATSLEGMGYTRP